MAIIQVNLCSLAPPANNWSIFGAKFYCPHALADGNQRIRITEKMLEFSTVWSTLPPYLSAAETWENIAYYRY